MNWSLALTNHSSFEGLKEVKLLLISVEINKKHGDLTIHWIKDVWGRKKKFICCFLISLFLPHHPRTLITVLNADMKFFHHFFQSPKALGNRTQCHCHSRKKKKKKVKQIYSNAYWWEIGERFIFPHANCIRHIWILFVFFALVKWTLYECENHVSSLAAAQQMNCPRKWSSRTWRAARRINC